MRRVRLVIADRRPIVLQGFESLFAAQTDFEVVASCLDGASCLQAIRKLTPDVVLVEDGFSDVTASEMLAVVNAENLPTRLVLYTASVARGNLAAAIAAGACSAISMRERPETLLQSLRLVAARPDLARVGKEKNGAFGENARTVLTEQEREVMRLVAQGLSNKAIARQLNVSPGTIKVRLKHIFEKLEINNRSELTALALSQRYGGIGVLAAVIFAAMDEGRAASPNSVGAGHMVTDTLTVMAADGTVEVVTIIINRPKEPSGASGTMTRAVIKARSAANAVAATPTWTSKLVDSSVDITGSTLTSAAFNAPRQSSGSYGAFMTAAVAVWIYVIDIIHSAAKALDIGHSAADASTSAAANGTTELATLTVASRAAASSDSCANPSSLNSSIYDWSFAFGTPRDDTTAFGDKLQTIDANAAEDIANGKDNSPHAAAADADTIYDGSATVNAFAGHTIDHGGFGKPTGADASEHFEGDTTRSAGDDSNRGQSQRDLHASEHGNAAAGKHAEHHAIPGSGANPGRDLHASEEGSAAAKPHAKHHAPGDDSNPGQLQRNFHASEDGSAAAEQHAKHDTTPESDVNQGQSQRHVHAAPVSASNNPHSASSLNAGGKDQATADGGQAQTPAAPEFGDSFHFKKEMAASKAPDIFEVHPGYGPASTEHDQQAARHDGPTPIPDTSLISLSLAEQDNIDHAKGAQHHVTHDLIV